MKILSLSMRYVHDNDRNHRVTYARPQQSGTRDFFRTHLEALRFQLCSGNTCNCVSSGSDIRTVALSFSLLHQAVSEGTPHLIPCTRSGSGWACEGEGGGSNFVMRTLVPSTDIMKVQSGAVSYSPSVLLSVRCGAPPSADKLAGKLAEEKAAAAADWQRLDQEELQEGRLREQSDKIVARSSDTLSSTELGFAQLALLEPVATEQAQAAIAEADPPGAANPALGGCLLDCESLRGAAWHSTREFATELSLNGVGVGVQAKIGAPKPEGHVVATVTGRIEIFDVQRNREVATE